MPMRLPRRLQRYAPGQSVSRFHVTRFWQKHAEMATGRVLEVGGYGRPAGYWTVNPEPTANAHYVCRVQDMPGYREWNVLRLSEILEHDPDPASVLIDCRRLLKDDGVLLLTVPFIYRVHETGTMPDYHRFTPQGLVDLCDRTGFEVKEMYALGGFWSVLMDIVRQRIALSRRPWLGWLLAPFHWLLVEQIEPRCGDWKSLWATHWGVYAVPVA